MHEHVGQAEASALKHFPLSSSLFQQLDTVPKPDYCYLAIPKAAEVQRLQAGLCGAPLKRVTAGEPDLSDVIRLVAARKDPWSRPVGPSA